MRLISSAKHGLGSIINYFPGVITFLAGLLIPTLVKAWLPVAEQSELGDMTWFDVALIIFVALSLTSLVYLRKQISNEVDRNRLSVRFYFKTADEDSDRQIYEPIISKIRAAKKSVRIFGSLRRPGTDSSRARQRYFSEIEKLIRKKIDGGEAFLYERVIQVQSLDFKNTIRQPYADATTLNPDLVDPRTLEHCENVMKLAKTQSARVQIFLRQLPPVMPMITLIVVDDEFLILCLPWLERSDVDIETETLGKGLVFHDTGSLFCTEMCAMLNVLTYNAAPILRVAPSKTHKDIDRIPPKDLDPA